MQLSEKLKGTYCTLFFDNFFNIPELMDKPFVDGIYAIGTVRSNRKKMPKLKEDKKIFKGERDFHYSNKIICCKWYESKPDLFLETNVDGMIGVSKVMK